MKTLWQDVRYGLRMLWKSPGFTLVAVVALALGVGANTTIFSFVNALVLRPLAGVRASEQLVAVYTSDYSSGLYGASSYPDYVDFRQQADAFQGLAAYEETLMSVSGGAEAERLRGAYVTGNYFDVLGVNARLGRALTTADDVTPGAHPVIVISAGLWRRRFGAEASALGRQLALDGRQFTVVGVAPEEFRGLRLGAPPEFWVPMMMNAPGALEGRGNRGLDITGRLKEGFTPAQAQAQLAGIAARLAAAYPDTNLGTLERPKEPRPITVVREARVEPTAQPAIRFMSQLLLGVVGLVLLIACANVANLLLARAAARQKEIAVRLALGAGRGRVVRQLLTESVLLAGLGGAVGLVAALWAVDVLPALLPPEDAGGLDLSLDWRVLAFTCAVTLVTGVLFGLVPALRATRVELTSALKDESGARGYGLRRFSLRGALVAAQLALSLVLLVGAGLFLHSLRRALTFDPGFAAHQLLLASLETRGANLNQEQGQLFYDQALERVRALPGVRAATLTRVIPLSGGGQRRSYQIAGYQPQPNEDRELNTNVVGPDFFTTMEIAVVRGRAFTAQDRAGAPPVVVVNEEFARRYFPDRDAVGQRLRQSPDEPYMEIVGVARNAKYRTLRERPLPFVYIPAAQEYQRGMTLVVRADGDPAALAGPVRAAVTALNRDVPVYAVRTMTEHIGAALASERLIATLLSVFGGAALLLAAVGLYGVMAYSVAQRTHEIGIRMALGAQRGDILRLVIGQGLAMVLVGAAAGLVIALAATRLVASLLFDLSATDPLAFAAVTILLALVALLACYLPARRAMKVDPMVALRYE
ncbi:MAG TPA: ABC transporter permease [Pyrinomonadaceae bacterium]|jgi:predicted permease